MFSELTHSDKEEILYRLGLEDEGKVEVKDDKIHIVPNDLLKNKLGYCNMEKEGVQYFRWAIFEHTGRREILALPHPGPKVSLEKMRGFFQNKLLIYHCKYLHPHNESAITEYQIRQIVFSGPEPTKYSWPENYKTYEEKTEIFHDCMKHEDEAILY